MIHDISQSREASVVEKTSLGVREETLEGCRAVPTVGPTIRLEVVDPISAGVCRFHPGSVKIGGTWHVAHFALPLKTSIPRPAPFASKLPVGGVGAGMAN